MANFDPYHKWLGISPKDQPPTHYRLLGIDLFETDPEVISTAADRQMVHVRSFQLGKDFDISQKLLNEIAAAKVCLLDVRKKAEYDSQLRKRLTPVPAAEPLPQEVIPVQTPSVLRPIRRKPQNNMWIVAGSIGVAVILLVVILAATSGRGGKGAVSVGVGTRPPKGRGKASHTDVMLRSGSHALAIEAKWTEPMYPTVEAWIKEGTNEDNRKLVLDGWLSLLQERVTKKLVPGDFDDAIYQMVHRAASAAASGDQPRLAYFLFELQGIPQGAGYREVIKRLRDLWSKLGNPASFPFYVVRIEMKPLQAYNAIRHLPKGEESTSDSVTAALQGDSPLFDFRRYEVWRIEEIC